MIGDRTQERKRLGKNTVPRGVYTVRFSAEIHQRMKIYAAQHPGETVGRIVERAVTQYLNRKERKSVVQKAA